MTKKRYKNTKKGSEKKDAKYLKIVLKKRKRKSVIRIFLRKKKQILVEYRTNYF